MVDAPRAQEWPPKNAASWQDREYSACLYCDQPWDHAITTADATIYVCLDCYERRSALSLTEQPAGKQPE